MCGFAGWLRWDGDPLGPGDRRELLRRMGAQLARRGPDGETRYDDGTLCFVFRRLAVNDVDGGGQPFHDESGTIVAAVNGEIAGHAALRSALTPRHVFAGRSDCEVVVHLYEDAPGPAFLDRLRGMFALLVWDRARRRGLLARDRLGIKPLYYARVGGGLLFSSELTALLAHPGCPRGIEPADLRDDHVGGENYTTPHYDRVPSFVRGVHVLGGGESIELRGDGAGEPRRYWSLLPAIARSREDPPRAPRAYVRDYADLLEESVRLHLTSDVPIGVFLSGGLDSSVLAAAAVAEGARPHCFSVREDTTVAAGDLGRAARLTRMLGVPFHPVRYDRATFAEDLRFSLASLEELVWAMDAPRFAPESFFKYELHRYAKTALPGLKVILAGQGADEFAGGYSTSLSSPRGTWRDYVADALEPRARAAADGAGALAPYHHEMLARLIALQSHNLWNEDRVAAAFGVETRVPFLDHRLVEFLAAIPPALHPLLFWNKAIVRAAARRWLPPELAEAPKVLFWQARDTSSVHAIMAACARRVYPEFRESYLGGGSRDPAGRFDALHRCVTGGGLGGGPPGAVDGAGGSRACVQRLLAGMTRMIFERLCGTLHTPLARVPAAAPSRLGPDPAWLPEGAPS